MSGCTIFRVKDKTKGFTIMMNEVFQRTDLSAKAKGLYGYLMTLPDDWKIYKQEVYKHFTDGKTRLDNAFKELEDAGYIKKERVRNENNLFEGWNFTIHETVEIPDIRFSENREPRQSVNQQLLSTNLKQSTDSTNIVVLKKWNEKANLTTHTKKIALYNLKKKHKDKISLYGIDVTLKAIDNYASILKSDKHYFNYKWTLWDFITRGLDKFVDDANPFENFLIRNFKQEEATTRRKML